MELKLEHVTKEFNRFKAVSGISYTMHNGVYGLLGVNGAGKTTTMRMLCTLLKPSEGKITYDGRDIFEMDGEYRKILGYLPQDFGYYPDLTVQDYLMYIASIKGLPSAVARKQVRELLEKVGLIKAKNKKMKKLSGGMKRRVGIAQAMLNDPCILILDEPTAGLDPNERIRFRNLISELSEDRIVLLSTHIVSDVEYIANKILLMRNGEFAHSGTVYELVSSIPEKVWNVRVGKAEADGYLKRYRCTNVKTLPEGVELRILSEQMPNPYAVEEEMTLEDVFLYYFGEKAGEENGIL